MVSGCGAAIHDNEVRFLQRAENAVQFAVIAQIQKPRIRMKTLQRRVLVVAINRNVRDTPVLEELHEVDREEAFADTAFAIEDEVETFHVLSGLSIRTCAMRGPRLRVCAASLPLKSEDASRGERASSVWAGKVPRPFGSAGGVGLIVFFNILYFCRIIVYHLNLNH